MGEKIKIIFVYLLAIFFAVFVGTGIFLILNNKKPPTEKEVITTSSTIPTVRPTQGSLSLKLASDTATKNSEIQIDLFADSNEKNIVGYDLVLSYDPLAFDFVKATSNL